MPDGFVPLKLFDRTRGCRDARITPIPTSPLKFDYVRLARSERRSRTRPERLQHGTGLVVLMKTSWQLLVAFGDACLAGDRCTAVPSRNAASFAISVERFSFTPSRDRVAVGEQVRSWC